MFRISPWHDLTKIYQKTIEPANEEVSRRTNGYLDVEGFELYFDSSTRSISFIEHVPRSETSLIEMAITLGIKAKTKCDDDRPCKRCKTRDIHCQETDGRKNSGQGSVPSTSQAEPSIAAASLLPVTTPYTQQLEQVSPHQSVEDVASFQMNIDPFGSSVAGSDFGFPDFFEQIMMPDVGSSGSHEQLSMPLNVADFTQGVFRCMTLPLLPEHNVSPLAHAMVP